MRAQDARASSGSPRIRTVIRADPRKADVIEQIKSVRIIVRIEEIIESKSHSM